MKEFNSREQRAFIVLSCIHGQHKLYFVSRAKPLLNIQHKARVDDHGLTCPLKHVLQYKKTQRNPLPRYKLKVCQTPWISSWHGFYCLAWIDEGFRISAVSGEFYRGLRWSFQAVMQEDAQSRYYFHFYFVLKIKLQRQRTDNEMNFACEKTANSTVTAALWHTRPGGKRKASAPGDPTEIHT